MTNSFKYSPVSTSPTFQHRTLKFSQIVKPPPWAEFEFERNKGKKPGMLARCRSRWSSFDAGRCIHSPCTLHYKNRFAHWHLSLTFFPRLVLFKSPPQINKTIGEWSHEQSPGPRQPVSDGPSSPFLWERRSQWSVIDAWYSFYYKESTQWKNIQTIARPILSIDIGYSILGVTWLRHDWILEGGWVMDSNSLLIACIPSYNPFIVNKVHTVGCWKRDRGLFGRRCRVLGSFLSQRPWGCDLWQTDMSHESLHVILQRTPCYWQIREKREGWGPEKG
jgi:hypothetical protein